MCVKPRNSNVSGLPEPRAFRSWAAYRPNSISRVFSGCSSKPNFANLLAKIGEEPLGVVTVLEARDVVVGEAHDDHVAVRVPPSPLVGPQVEHVVQVDVGEQRRNRCPLRRPLLASPTTPRSR